MVVFSWFGAPPFRKKEQIWEEKYVKRHPNQNNLNRSLTFQKLVQKKN